MAIPFSFNRKQPSPYALKFLPSYGEQVDQVQPLATQPIDIQPELQPQQPTASSLSKIGPPPIMIGTDNGRPNEVVGGGSDLERAQAKRGALEDYQPQKAGWKSWLPFIVNSALAGGRYGGAGALGGLATGIAEKYIQPKHPNEVWKEKELGKANKTIDTLGQQQDESIERQIRQKQLDDLQNPKPQPLKPKPTGFRVLTKDEGGLKAGTKIQQEFDPATGKWNDTDRVLDLPNEKAESDKIGSATRIVGDGEYGLPAGTKIHLMPNGEDAVVNGKPLVAEIAPVVKPDTAEFTNEQVQQNITEALGEKEKVKSALRDTAPTVPLIQNGVEVGTQPNPIYTDLQKHDRELDDKVREWRLKLKPTTKVSPKSGPIKPAKDGKFHYTEAQIRAAIQPGQTYEDVYAKLKTNPKVVIEE